MAPQPKRQAKATMPAPKRTKLDPRQLKLTRFFTGDLLASPSVPATRPFISTASLPDNENGRTTSANTEDITSDSRVVEEHTRTTDGRHELIPDEEDGPAIPDDCPDWAPDDDVGPEPNTPCDEFDEPHVDAPDTQAHIEAILETIKAAPSSLPDSKAIDAADNKHVATCDEQMRRILEFLFRHADTLDWNQVGEDTSWVGRSAFYPIRNASLDTVCEFFRTVIPFSTRATLGNEMLTLEQKLDALPNIDPKSKHQGVYICRVHSHEDKGGLYTGSTLGIIIRRQLEHLYNIKKSREAGKGQGRFYRYMVESEDRVAEFKLIASWPQAESGGWLARLLETVIMLMLGTFEPAQAPPAFTVNQEALAELVATCNLENNEFEKLNAALPTKQGCQSRGRRICNRCGDQSTGERKIKWLYNPKDPLAATFLCEPCYRYPRNHNGKERPLGGRVHAAPTEGPCANPACEATESPTWCWHLDSTGIKEILCRKCHTWMSAQPGQYRPREVVTRTTELRTCVQCGTSSDAAWRWYCVEDGFKCRDCYHELRKLPTAVDARTCIVCQTDNPATWVESPQMCKPCSDDDRMAREHHKEINPICPNCSEKFGSNGRKRRWIVSTKEFICDMCFLQGTEGWLRLTSAHLKGVDFRCELCETRYSVKWAFHGANKPHALPGSCPLLCNRCYQAKWTMSKSVGHVSRRDWAVAQGELTYFESIKNKARLNRVGGLYGYLKRVHALDFSRVAVESAGSIMSWLKDLGLRL